MSEFEVPFKIDRNDRLSLTDQIVEGVRQAIDSGCYRPGDFVPGIRPLAQALGVSDIVTRRALCRLGEEGLLVPRRGFGNVVADRREHQWRGRVLYVPSGHNENYVYNVIGDVLRERLFRLGYQFVQVPAWASADGEGVVQLACALRQRYDAVVTATPPLKASRLLQASGNRVVEICGRDVASGLATVEIRFDHQAGTEEFVRHCRSAGIRKVISVFCGRSRRFGSMTSALRCAGVQVSEWTIDPHDAKRGVVETVCRRTLGLFETWLSRKRGVLPDLFYFTDDHVATAALQALMHHVVRIPEDVRVVTWENVGLGPVFHRSLTRFSFDPVASGHKVAEVVEALLLRNEALKGCVLAPDYVRGETFA